MIRRPEIKSDKIWRLGCGLALAVLAAAAFAQFQGAPFLFDDLHTIRDNPHLRDRLSPWYFMTHPESASLLPSTLTRPLLTFSYALDFHRAGPDPDAFRFTNFCLHLLNALLIVRLTRKAPGLARLSPWAGVLFLLHPLLSVQVGYVSNRSTLLSSTCYLAGLLAYARGLDAYKNEADPPSMRSILGSIVLAAVLFAGGLGSKEAAATLPAAVALWHLAFGTRPARSYTAAALAALGLVFLGFLAYRRAFSAPVLFPPARPWPVWQYAASQVPAVWTYLRLLVWPVHLALEHDAWRPHSPADLLHPRFLAAATALAALIALAIARLRKDPALGFAGLFALLYLLPTSSVIPLTMLVNENRPYLSALIFIWPLLMAVQRVKLAPGRERLALAGLTVVFALMVGARGWEYRSEERMWREAVGSAPGLARAWVNLGVCVSSYGRMEEAAGYYRRALVLEPCHPLALSNLGNLASRQGDPAGAEKLYRQSLACDPGTASAAAALAELLLTHGRDNEAVEILERGRAHARDPASRQRLQEILNRIKKE